MGTEPRSVSSDFPVENFIQEVRVLISGNQFPFPEINVDDERDFPAIPSADVGGVERSHLVAVHHFVDAGWLPGTFEDGVE